MSNRIFLVFPFHRGLLNPRHLERINLFTPGSCPVRESADWNWISCHIEAISAEITS